MFPLDLKGRFYATVAVLYITGTFYARYFGAYLPLCLNIIKGRLYANHMSGVKASLYDNKQTQGRVYALRSRPFLAGLSMRKILLSGVKASLFDTEQTQGRVYAPRG